MHPNQLPPPNGAPGQMPGSMVEPLADAGINGDSEMSIIGGTPAHTTPGEIVVTNNVLDTNPALRAILQEAFQRAGMDINRYTVQNTGGEVMQDMSAPQQPGAVPIPQSPEFGPPGGASAPMSLDQFNPMVGGIPKAAAAGAPGPAMQRPPVAPDAMMGDMPGNQGAPAPDNSFTGFDQFFDGMGGGPQDASEAAGGPSTSSGGNDNGDDGMGGGPQSASEAVGGGGHGVGGDGTGTDDTGSISNKGLDIGQAVHDNRGVALAGYDQGMPVGPTFDKHTDPTGILDRAGLSRDVKDQMDARTATQPTAEQLGRLEKTEVSFQERNPGITSFVKGVRDITSKMPGMSLPGTLSIASQNPAIAGMVASFGSSVVDAMSPVTDALDRAGAMVGEGFGFDGTQDIGEQTQGEPGSGEEGGRPPRETVESDGKPEDGESENAPKTYELLSAGGSLNPGVDPNSIINGFVGRMSRADQMPDLFARVYGSANNRNPGTSLPMFADDEFNEDFYLQSNADVREAVERGDFASGRDHWERHGQAEERQGYEGHKTRGAFRTADRQIDPKLLGGKYTSWEDTPYEVLEARKEGINRGFAGGENWGDGRYGKYLGAYYDHDDNPDTAYVGRSDSNIDRTGNDAGRVRNVMRDIGYGDEMTEAWGQGGGAEFLAKALAERGLTSAGDPYADALRVRDYQAPAPVTREPPTREDIMNFLPAWLRNHPMLRNSVVQTGTNGGFQDSPTAGAQQQAGANPIQPGTLGLTPPPRISRFSGPRGRNRPSASFMA